MIGVLAQSRRWEREPTTIARPEPSPDPSQAEEIRQLIIIGGGPAAYTAAIYAARADLHPLVIEGSLWGGQLMQSATVENYPGFVDGIDGPELVAAMRAQAARFGADLLTEDVTQVELQSGGPGGGIKRIWVGERLYQARMVIIATGTTPGSAPEERSPNSQLFAGQLQMDWQGRLTTVPGCTMTIGAQGVYAAGDVADSTYQQAVTAAASGCMAAMDVLRHIEGGFLDRDIFAERG